MPRKKKDENVFEKAKDAVVVTAEKGGEAVHGIFNGDKKERGKTFARGRKKK